MNARFATVLMAALLGSVTCADAPGSGPAGTGAAAEAAGAAVAPSGAEPDAAQPGPGGSGDAAAAAASESARQSAARTTPSSEGAASPAASTTGGAGLPTGSLPPGRPVLPQAEREPQTYDLAALGVDRGSPDAPVRVVEFSDYGCGYCRKFHMETWPTLRREFVESGKVEWKLLVYVSGMFQNSSAATSAAECVLEQGESSFEAMNSLVWEQQREWKGAADPLPALRDLAGRAGADMSRYDECMKEGRPARRVAAANTLAGELGVRATPTFFVVGYPPIQGALPTEAFQRILEMVHAEATRPGGGP